MSEITKEVTVKTDGNIRKAYCNKCGDETNHTILYSKNVYWKEEVDVEEVGYIDGGNTHSLVECTLGRPFFATNLHRGLFTYKCWFT
jgi:hypothetical protein